MYASSRSELPFVGDKEIVWVEIVGCTDGETFTNCCVEGNVGILIEYVDNNG